MLVCRLYKTAQEGSGTMAKKQQRQLTQKEKREQIRSHLTTAPSLSDRVIAKTLGVSHVTVGAVRREMRTGSGHSVRVTTPNNTEWLNHPYILDNPNLLYELNERGLRAIKVPGVLDIMAERGLTSPIYAQRVLHKREKAARKNATGMTILDKNVIIKQDDLLTGLEWIQDNQVDLICTDLPYSKKYLPLYSALSKLAGRVLLADGGSLLCMTGQSALPAVLNALCEDERLRYHWTLSAVMNRVATHLFWLNVSTHWKPIVHLSKNGAYKGDLYSDLVTTAKPLEQQREIPWQQPQEAFDTLVERFVQRAGMTLLDPCCGSGTSLIAGIRAGCSRVIGVDIDEKAIKIAKKRVDELLYGRDTAE
jgi:16S rRNA G966 N2-methylase RsmD